ncbi:MAG: hypothetical protein ACI9ND_001082 [Yoonia sp.]|jgi:hypothetical protein
MSDVHTVHNAPASPDRLKRDAYARLLSTARRIRLAHLERLFQRHDLRINDLLITDAKTCAPKLGVEMSETVIADLTHAVRLLSSTWITARPGRLDHDLVELARKTSDYLDVDAHVGMRLKRWASAYASHHVGPPAFEKLDTTSQTLLRSGSGPLHLAGPNMDHGVDELVAGVHARAPWMSEATTVIWQHLRASRAQGRSGLALPPLLLHGPPGTGKSTLARILAEQAQVPHIELDVGAGTAAFRIVGVEAGWSTRQIGDVVRLVCESKTANCLIIINEIDKIGRGSSATSGTRTSMSDALLPLLERGTAARFRCPASGLDHDLSRINWIATANEISHVDPVLRSRLEPVEVPSLSHAALNLYIDLAIPETDRAAMRRILSDVALGPQLTLRHIRRLADRLRGSEQDHFIN